MASSKAEQSAGRPGPCGRWWRSSRPRCQCRSPRPGVDDQAKLHSSARQRSMASVSWISLPAPGFWSFNSSMTRGESEVAADDEQAAGSKGGLGLLDHAGELPDSALVVLASLGELGDGAHLLAGDDAVAADLLLRARGNGDDGRAAVGLGDLHHARQDRCCRAPCSRPGARRRARRRWRRRRSGWRGPGPGARSGSRSPREGSRPP